MKKLYLIDDDSKNQRTSYGASFVNDGVYADILCHIEKVNEDFDLCGVSEAACLMVHESLEDYVDGHFLPTSHIAQDNLIHFADTNSIPYVCFSDGHEKIGDFDSSGNIVALKKSEFYGRLKHFLDFYRDKGTIDLRLLAYGKNYKKHEFERWIKSLYLKISRKQSTDRLTLSDVMPKDNHEPQYLKNIIDGAQPAVGIDYNDLLDAIEDDDLTVGEFKRNINHIFNSISKYGTNTHTWK